MSLDPRHKSRTLLDGRDRAPARSYLKAIGFSDADLARPIVGVANTWTETMPCNFNLRRLAEYVKRGVREAGGTPMEFNTIAISDGITMGTEGMKTSLVSREVIADSIELEARGHKFNPLLVLVGCDKTHEVGRQAGALVMDMLRRGLRPRQIATRAAFENAIAGVAASGGSTNAVLHLLALAREIDVPLTIDDFDRVSRRTPVWADLKPWGRFTAVDLGNAGGGAVVGKRLVAAGLVDGSALTPSGRTFAEEAGRAPDRRPLQRRHARPDGRSHRARGGGGRPNRGGRGGRHDRLRRGEAPPRSPGRRGHDPPAPRALARARAALHERRVRPVRGAGVVGRGGGGAAAGRRGGLKQGSGKTCGACGVSRGGRSAKSPPCSPPLRVVRDVRRRQR